MISSESKAVYLVKLDASTWAGPSDFYRDVLDAIGAPDWHGRNFNALWEALVQGGTECVPPPIEIVVSNTAALAVQVVAELTELSDLVRSGCDELRMNPGSRICLLPHVSL